MSSHISESWAMSSERLEEPSQKLHFTGTGQNRKRVTDSKQLGGGQYLALSAQHEQLKLSGQNRKIGRKTELHGKTWLWPFISQALEYT